jgi:branched-chain amino acid transport system substrate-binding protein
VAGRTISERAMAWTAGGLVTVIVATVLIGKWPTDMSTRTRPSPSPATADATVRPLGTQPAVATAPVYLAVGDSPSPYPSADPVLTPSSPPGAKVIRIGVSLPLSGTWSADGGPARDAVLAAIQNAGELSGYTIEPVIWDAVRGNESIADQAAQDMHSFVDDPSVMGVVGPLDSEAAWAQIPIGNAAGLVQCSPGASATGLTRGPGTAMLNALNPTKRTFVRLASTTDSQAMAMAKWAQDRLRSGSVLVISDSTTEGKRLAKTFEASFKSLRGLVSANVDSAVSSTAFEAVLATAPLNTTAVFFGSTNPRAAAILRAEMNHVSTLHTILMTTDAVYDDPWSGASWYLGQAGAAGAADTRAARSVWSDFPGVAGFNAWLKSTTHRETGTYSAAAFACTQVILNAIAKVAATGPVTREAVRRTVIDPSATVQTAVGPVSFDDRGDSRVQPVTIFAPDSAATPPYTWMPDLSYEVAVCEDGMTGPPCWLK